MTKILHGCLDGLELCHQMIKTMLEYVRSGDYLTHPSRKHFHSRTHICQLQLQQTPANLFVKACVCYFFRNFHFSPNGSPSKTMKDVFLFHLKNSFRFWDIQIFVFFLSVSHFLKAWSKINLKVCDIFNCLKKNFVWYLEKKKKVWHWKFGYWYSINQEHFYGKIIQKMCTKRIKESQTPFLFW